jgi:hypothetical protein
MIELFRVTEELFGRNQDIEHQADKNLAQFIIKEKNFRMFKRHGSDLLTQMFRQIVEPLADSANTPELEALCNAWYDVARYQTDAVDAKNLWRADEETLRYLLELCPPPETPEERHKLNTPQAVKRQRENYFERVFTPEQWKTIQERAAVMETTVALEAIYHDAPDDIKKVPMKTICVFPNEDGQERVIQWLKAKTDSAPDVKDKL